MNHSRSVKQCTHERVARRRSNSINSRRRISLSGIRTVFITSLAVGALMAISSGIVNAQSAVSSGTSQHFKPGDRVEVNVNGTWYAASVTNAQDDRYRLVRDDSKYGVASSDEWVSVDRLRPLAARPAATIPAVAGLPNAVPAGLYSCTLFGSGNTAGKLRILNGTTSSGITPDGAGPQHQFKYDARTGALSWVGGMQIFSWTVEQALYGPDGKGIPNITLHYRVRAGGNLNSMGCKRE